MCMYIYMLTYIYTHTPTELAHSIIIFGTYSVIQFMCLSLYSFWLDADKCRMYVGLCMSGWPGVKWSRGLHEWDQLSMCAQWSTVPAWSNTDCRLQHLVCSHFKLLIHMHACTHAHTHIQTSWTLGLKMYCDGHIIRYYNSVVSGQLCLVMGKRVLV